MVEGNFPTPPLPFNSFFTPFFFLAKEKGPKRTAPLGAGPVFPQITSRENTSNGGLLATRPLQRCVAGRNNAEKPPTAPFSHFVRLWNAVVPPALSLVDIAKDSRGLDAFGFSLAAARYPFLPGARASSPRCAAVVFVRAALVVARELAR